MNFGNYQYVFRRESVTVMVIMNDIVPPSMYLLHCFPVSVTYLNTFLKRGQSHYHRGEIDMDAVYNPKNM